MTDRDDGFLQLTDSAPFLFAEWRARRSPDPGRRDRLVRRPYAKWKSFALRLLVFTPMRVRVEPSA